MTRIAVRPSDFPKVAGDTSVGRTTSDSSLGLLVQHAPFKRTPGAPSAILSTTPQDGHSNLPRGGTPGWREGGDVHEE